MSSILISRNEKKARAKAVVYTILVIGGLAALLMLSTDTEVLIESVKALFSPEAPAVDAPVA